MEKVKTFLKPKKNRPFVCYFQFTGWGCISLGFHVDFRMLNIELHIPFGFVRIGYESSYESYFVGTEEEYNNFKIQNSL